VATKSDVSTIVVNTDTIAKIFGLTSRRVRQLVEEGIIERVGHGRFQLIETTNKYITYLRLASENEDSLEETLGYEKFLHERAKREKAELQLAHIKNQMHRSEDIEQVMNSMLSNFRARLLALPSKVAPSLVARENINMIEHLIQDEIYEALTELSEYSPSLFGVDPEEVEDDEEDETEEDQENVTSKQEDEVDE